jgi:hypothetical protein
LRLFVGSLRVLPKARNFMRRKVFHMYGSRRGVGRTLGQPHLFSRSALEPLHSFQLRFSPLKVAASRTVAVLPKLFVQGSVNLDRREQ